MIAIKRELKNWTSLVSYSCFLFNIFHSKVNLFVFSKCQKEKCKFLDSYTAEWSCMKKGKNDYSAYCSICATEIYVANGGKSSIQHHITSAKHQSKLSTASCSKDISSFMVKKNTKIFHLIQVAEITTAYRIISHHQSFSSLDCTTKLDSVYIPIQKSRQNNRTPEHISIHFNFC